MNAFYHADIIGLSRANINAGLLPNAPKAKQSNPWCGDECLMSARFDGGRIVRSMHQTRGCILTLAAAAKATTTAEYLGDPAQVLQLIQTLAKTLRTTPPPKNDSKAISDSPITEDEDTPKTEDSPKATTLTTTEDTPKAAGLTIADGLSSFPPEIAKSLDIFTPVIAAKNRHTCILLPFLALADIINNQTTPVSDIIRNDA